MSETTGSVVRTRCLILACGNVLREDDGVGPWLATWAYDRFREMAEVRILARHQWTPELAEDLAQADTAIFIDSVADAVPGRVQFIAIDAATESPALMTHHLDSSQLIRLAQELYGSQPRQSLLLTVGAGSMELREGFSEAVLLALPEACGLLERAILDSISPSA